MNSFAQLIINRRSVRQYTGDLLLSDEITQIVKAALLAPTSKNSHSWQFVLIEDKETLKNLSLCKPSTASFIANCALAIVVTTDSSLSEAYIEDAAIAATYIQLQAEDLDLGTCWCQVRGRETADGYDSERYVRDLLGIPSQISVGCIIAIGHKARMPKPHDESKLQWEKLHIRRYKNDSPAK
jgi:nitroreductase